MVRAYQVKDELNRIIRETKAPIIISDIGRYRFGYIVISGRLRTGYSDLFMRENN